MLYVWMPEGDGAWYWSTGENWLRADSLELLIQELKFRTQSIEDAIVFFPSHHVQILKQPIAKNNYKQLGQEGIKFLLEEYVTLPIDQMHVVHHFQNDQLYVLGLSEYEIQTWLHTLSLLPLKITSLLPDFLVLPAPTADQRILANIAGRLLVRESEWMGHGVDELAVYLELESPDQAYHYAGLSDQQLNILTSSTLADKNQEFDYMLPVIPKAYNHPYNVLPKGKNQSQKISGYWKVCALLLIALLVMQFSYDLMRWVKLRQMANATATQAITQYQHWFGTNERVIEQNLKNQFESHLRLSQQGDMQMLSFLSRIGPVLMQNQIFAQQINYDNAIFTLSLKAKSANDLQTLAQQLKQQGLTVELGNVQPDGTGSLGVVKIR